MNKYLEQIIRIKLAKMNNEQITNENFEKITELGLNNVTFSNKPKDIDLSEIKPFSNLQILTLQNFQIDDIDLNLLSEFKNLKTLQISSCNISSNKTHQIPALEKLIINTSQFKNFPKIILPKSVVINGINRNIDLENLEGIENVENIYLTNIKKIVNFEIVYQMRLLNILNIDGSKIDNKKVLENLRENISVSHKPNSLKIV